MSTKLFTTIAIICIANISLYAQSKNQISGTIKDKNKNQLIGVTVSLLQQKDSSLVKASITDIDGKFEIEESVNGSFILNFSSVETENEYSIPFNYDAEKGFVVSPIALKTIAHQLNDVVITSKKPTIEVKADKVVFNVENSINATGSNALELLQKSPGVRVDNNDNISMKGKSGVAIYIDGKISQLDSKSLADYLKSINSNDIEAIEMIANPSSKFDASGNAGIINIRLKKNKKLGTNGNVNLGLTQGYTAKGNGSVSLNYRDKKINLFSNIGGNIGDNRSNLNIYRIQSDTIYNQNTIMTHKRKNANIKAGADYFLDDKNTIGVLVNSNFSGGSFNAAGGTDIYDPSMHLIKTLKSSNYVPGNSSNSDFNVNYRFADTNSTEINYDMDYGLFHSTAHSYQPNYYYGPNNDLQYSVINGNNTPIDIHIYTAKLDITHKLGKGQIGYGAKIAFVKTNNTFNFFNYAGDIPMMDLSQSNNFAYTENVNAAYLNYNRSFNAKWSLQAGLRAEQTHSSGELSRADGQVQADNTVKRNYLNLFPSAALTYNVNKDNTLGLTYSRRIDRPDYQDLNPFEMKLDQLTYEKGNAFLKPQYTDNIELNYTFKSMITASVGYSHVRDYAVTITDTVDGNATYLQKQNIASQKVWSFNLGSPLNIRKWWTGYASIWYNYQTVKGGFNNTIVDLKSPGYGLYMQNTFALGKDYATEVSGWFNGKSIDGTWIVKPIGGMDIGIQKKILDKKGTIKLTVTDVFRSMHAKVSSDLGNTNIMVDQFNESRTIRLNFSYRFGSNQIKDARQRKTAAESEGSRIK